MMISLVCGPVCSGKTSEVLRLLERACIAKKNVVLVRPTIDNRGFLSHCERDTSWLTVIYDDLSGNQDYSQYDVIGLDEIQFQSNIREFCTQQALDNKDIVMAGLHSSSELEMFDPVIEVIPLCDKIVKLNAICVLCGSELGSHSYYLCGNKDNKIEVGGTDKYSSLCFGCYFKKRNF